MRLAAPRGAAAPGALRPRGRAAARRLGAGARRGGASSRRALDAPRRSGPSVRRAVGAAAPSTVAAAEPAQSDDAAVAEEAQGPRRKKVSSLRFNRSENGGIKNLTVTTPLFYANGAPHIGSAYPTIAADVVSRYAQMSGGDVHFVTGMDEHGEKIAKTAEGKDMTPQQLVDSIAGDFQGLWDKLNIRNQHFARTTQPKHREIVAEMWQRCLDSGDIYKKDYEGWYCVGCEAYLDADEMEDDHVCKIHRKKAELRREENYFFRLSKYWEKLTQHMEDNPDFLLPQSRASQVMVWLDKDNKRDFSISRASTDWGIPVPGDDSQVIYVWFDALLGYLSSLLRPEDPATLDTCLKRGWPADIHVIGKDIMRFHALYWPAMLMSAGLPLPKHIVTHGFLTKDGLKMGKSLGNVVEPVPLVENFGADAVRFFFAGCLSFGQDGDFAYESFINQVNSELANELGNLLQRILTLCRKNLPEPSGPDCLYEEAELQAHPVYRAALAAPAEAAAAFERFDFPAATQAALRIANAANAHIMVVVPWKKLKSEDEQVRGEALRELQVMAEGVRICAVLLAPVTPSVSGKVLEGLHGAPQPAPAWSDARWAGARPLAGLAEGLPKPTPLFPRLDVEEWRGK